MSTHCYTQAEVETILRRAAELEREAAPADNRTEFGELEKIAREAGIPEALVRQAARELADAPAAPKPQTWSLLFGGPLRQSFVQTVAKPWSSNRFDELLPLLRQLGRDSWQARTLGRTLTATGWTGGGVVNAEVTSIDGTTTIRLDSSLMPHLQRTRLGSLAGVVALLLLGSSLGAAALGVVGWWPLSRWWVNRLAAEQRALVERVGNALTRTIEHGTPAAC